MFKSIINAVVITVVGSVIREMEEKQRRREEINNVIKISRKKL